MAKIFTPSKSGSPRRKGARGRPGVHQGRDSHQEHESHQGHKGGDDTVELEIERLADDGRGIARRDGKVVFVADALPGERVLASITARSRRFDQAMAERRLTESPQRTSPFCRHYGVCGGCQMQHVDIDSQRQHKSQRLIQALTVGREQTTLKPRIVSAASEGYRHRVRLHYRQGRLGFIAGQSNALVDIDACPLLQPALASALEAIRQPIIDALGDHDSGELRLAAGDDGRVGISLRSHQSRRPQWCQNVAEQLSAVTLFSVDDQQGRWNNDAPPLALSITDDVTLAFGPDHFTQANPDLNRKMVAQCLQWLQPSAGEWVADYFCGLGNFSRPLARAGCQVLAVDLDRAMLAEAERQRDRGRESIDFRSADLFDSAQIPLPATVEKVLLDPPRAGARVLCQRIGQRQGVRRVVYVSCDPATLKRDVATLVDSGFRPIDAVMVDMFPHTQHQESMVLLER